MLSYTHACYRHRFWRGGDGWLHITHIISVLPLNLNEIACLQRRSLAGTQPHRGSIKMLPAGILLASGVTLTMLIAWIQQLRQDWLEWQARELHVLGCREAQAIVANLPALLVIQPDCDLNVAARMRRTTPEQPKRVPTRVQDLRHARKLQGASECTVKPKAPHTRAHAGRMPSFVEVDIAPILAHIAASHAPWQGNTDSGSFSSTSSMLSEATDDSDDGQEEPSVALALARNAAMTPDFGKQCDADAPVFQVGSPQVPGWSHAA